LIRASAIALLLVVMSPAAVAGSYILPSDEELVRRADAIGTFTVTSANSYYGADKLIYTRYSLATGERIKGEAPVTTYLTEMGGVVGSRMFSVSTSPAYVPGERILVFLERRGDAWTTLDGQMGKFTFARGPDGSEVLVRDQDAFAILTARSTPLASRDAVELIDRIRNLARETRDLHPLQQSSAAAIGAEDAAAGLTFDTGRAPWNSDPASSIDIGNAGETAAVSYGTGDYQNVIHFNVPPTFCYGNPPTCPLTGTVVGQTQLWASAKSHSFRGEEFYTADECDVIVRADLKGSILNEVTAHELGHCLGIRHSNLGEPSSGDALMKSGIGGVGANLRTWDRDAANMVYGDGTATASFPGNAYLMPLGAVAARGARWPDGALALSYHSMAAAPCVAPEITSDPRSTTIASRERAILSVFATGTAPLSYQWYAGGTPSTGIAIPGANGVAYETPTLESSQSYSVRVTNDCGSVDSDVATVSVAPVRRRAVRRS
jgi:hypothetical protein